MPHSAPRLLKHVLPAALLAAALLRAAPPVITDISPVQDPDNGKVTVTYRVTDDDAETVVVRAELSADGGQTWSVPFGSYSGDIGRVPADGTLRTFVWNAAGDWRGKYSETMQVRLFADDRSRFPGEAADPAYWGDPVPAGRVRLGPSSDAEGRGTWTDVVLPYAFRLARCEVTVAQYCDFLNTVLAEKLAEYRPADGCIAVTLAALPYGISNTALCRVGTDSGILWGGAGVRPAPGTERLPARVFWQGALLYSRYYGADLPTEAEWERAARGPGSLVHTLYPWGNAADPTRANLRAPALPVGSFPAGPFGLCDMIGNAGEWTRSRDLPLKGPGSALYPASGADGEPAGGEESPDALRHTDASFLDNANAPHNIETRIIRGLLNDPTHVRRHGRIANAAANFGETAGFRPVRRSSASADGGPIAVPVAPAVLFEETMDTWDPADRSTWTSRGIRWNLTTQSRVEADAAGNRFIRVGRMLAFPDIPELANMPVGTNNLIVFEACNDGPRPLTLRLCGRLGAARVATLPPAMKAPVTLTFPVPPGGIVTLLADQTHALRVADIRLQSPAVDPAAYGSMVPHLIDTLDRVTPRTSSVADTFATPLGEWQSSPGEVAFVPPAGSDTPGYFRLHRNAVLRSPMLQILPTGIRLLARAPDGDAELTVSDSRHGTLGKIIIPRSDTFREVTLMVPSLPGPKLPTLYTSSVTFANHGLGADADIAGICFLYPHERETLPTLNAAVATPDNTRSERTDSLPLPDGYGPGFTHMQISVQNPSGRDIPLMLSNGTGTVARMTVPGSTNSPTPLLFILQQPDKAAASYTLKTDGNSLTFSDLRIFHRGVFDTESFGRVGHARDIYHPKNFMISLKTGTWMIERPFEDAAFIVPDISFPDHRGRMTHPMIMTAGTKVFLPEMHGRLPDALRVCLRSDDATTLSVSLFDADGTLLARSDPVKTALAPREERMLNPARPLDAARRYYLRADLASGIRDTVGITAVEFLYRDGRLPSPAPFLPTEASVLYSDSNLTPLDSNGYGKDIYLRSWEKNVDDGKINYLPLSMFPFGLPEGFFVEADILNSGNGGRPATVALYTDHRAATPNHQLATAEVPYDPDHPQHVLMYFPVHRWPDDSNGPNSRDNFKIEMRAESGSVSVVRCWVRSFLAPFRYSPNTRTRVSGPETFDSWRPNVQNDSNWTPYGASGKWLETDQGIGNSPALCIDDGGTVVLPPAEEHTLGYRLWIRQYDRRPSPVGEFPTKRRAVEILSPDLKHRYCAVALSRLGSSLESWKCLTLPVFGIPPGERPVLRYFSMPDTSPGLFRDPAPGILIDNFEIWAPPRNLSLRFPVVRENYRDSFWEQMPSRNELHPDPGPLQNYMKTEGWSFDNSPRLPQEPCRLAGYSDDGSCKQPYAAFAWTIPAMQNPYLKLTGSSNRPLGEAVSKSNLLRCSVSVTLGKAEQGLLYTQYRILNDRRTYTASMAGIPIGSELFQTAVFPLYAKGTPDVIEFKHKQLSFGFSSYFIYEISDVALCTVTEENLRPAFMTPASTASLRSQTAALPDSSAATGASPALSAIRHPLSTVHCSPASSAFFTCDTGGRLTDTDSNGLPDWWERTHAAADPHSDTDGDGLTNLKEYTFGTDPNRAESAFTLSLRPADTRHPNDPNTTMLLTWNAVPHRTYTVQTAATPAGPWTDLCTLPGPSAPQELTVPLPSATPTRLLRISVTDRPN